MEKILKVEILDITENITKIFAVQICTCKGRKVKYLKQTYSENKP